MILIWQDFKMLQVRNSVIPLILFLVVLFFPLTTKVYADGECTPITAGPSLYQIDRKVTQDTLYFTPINDQIQSYTIIYGLKPEDERYSITFNSGVSTGAVTYTVNDLTPGVEYFYKVSATTSC